MMHQNTIRANVGSFIYAKNTNRFLFLLRDSEKKYKGTWGIVGGRLEADENWEDGLHREISEELGVSLEKNVVVPISTYTSDNQGFKYHTFIIVVEREFIPELNNEHSGFAWTALENYPRPLHPGVWKTVSIVEVQEKISTVTDLFS